MPSLMRPPLLSYALASITMRASLCQAEHLAVRKIVGTRPGKIVEGALRNADDVMLDELRAFARAILRVLEGAFPLQHRPAIEIMGCKLGEDTAEIDLSVAQRAEPPCPVHPALETAIYALPPGRIELRILDVKGFYAVVIDVDIIEIVELLQQEVRRIVEQVRPRVVVHPFEEHLIADAVMQVFAGMNLVADVDAILVGIVEERGPASCQLIERGF